MESTQQTTHPAHHNPQQQQSTPSSSTPSVSFCISSPVPNLSVLPPPPPAKFALASPSSVQRYVALRFVAALGRPPPILPSASASNSSATDEIPVDPAPSATPSPAASTLPQPLKKCSSPSPFCLRCRPLSLFPPLCSDLHSLNNRLIQVEAALAQVTAYFANLHTHPSSASTANSTGPVATVHPDKAFFAGSALSISQDIVQRWLSHLDIDDSLCPSFHSPDLSNPIKHEPSATYAHGLDPDLENDPASTLALPPISVYHPSSNSSIPSSSPSTSVFPYVFPPNPSPSITPALLANLPASPYRTVFLDHVQHFLRLRPSFHWHPFRTRIERLFSSFDDAPFDLTPGSTSVKSKAQTARDILFGSSGRSPPRPGRGASSQPRQRSNTPPTPSTASFFAVTAATFALGALLASKRDRDDDDDSSYPSSSPLAMFRPNQSGDGVNDRMAVDDGARFPLRMTGGGNRSKRLSPAYLHALSAQALSVHEASAPFDVDYLLACILQVLFFLQGGDEYLNPDNLGKSRMDSVGGVLLPLVRRMDGFCSSPIPMAHLA